MIEYTYTDADNVSIRAIDPGDYDVTVTGFEFGMAKTGTDKLDLTLRVEELGADLKESIFFTPKAQWKFDLVLKCFAPSKNVQLPQKGMAIQIDPNFVQTYIMGGRGRVTVKNEEYPIGSGEERSRVSIYHPDMSNQRVNNPQVMAQQAQAQVAQPVQVQPAQPVQQSLVSGDDDSVPF